MTRKVKATIAALTTLILYVSINSLARTVRPNAWVWYDEDKEENKKLPRLKFFTEAEFTAYPGGADIAKKNPNWMWDLSELPPISFRWRWSSRKR